MDKYYAHIENDVLVGRGQVIVDNTLCIEVTKDIYDNIEKYIYKDGEIVLNPNYEEEQLQLYKEKKFQECLDKANDYINNIVLYRDIECTDGNIAKLTADLFALQQGVYEKVIWVTKHDFVMELLLSDVVDILQNIGQIQTEVWSVKYLMYRQQIGKCKTIEEVNQIEIDYSK